MVLQTHHFALPAGTMVRRFRIERCLGKGGFAFTYLATDTKLGHKVAIKELFRTESVTRRGHAVYPISMEPSLVAEWKGLLRKFTDEAKHLALFRHPNIVTVQASFEENNTSYIVMNYVDGQTFSQYLRKLPRRPSEADLLPVLTQVLDGLEAVHAARLLHRDVKPNNIYLTRRNEVILLDFGAARPDGERNGKSTFIFHADGYSPPEQYTSTEPLTPASDIYATAATLVRAITMKDPQPACERNVKDKYMPLAVAYRGRYSPALLKGIDAAMALKADRRPKSIAQWRKMLLRKGSVRTKDVKSRTGDTANWVLAIFICLVLAFTSAWIAARMSAEPEHQEQVTGKISDAGLHQIAMAPISTAKAGAVTPPEPHPQEKVPGSEPPAASENENERVKSQVVATRAQPTTPPPTDAVASAAMPPPKEIPAKMDRFLKEEIEQRVKAENYAESVTVNDTGETADLREMSRTAFMAEEARDEARYAADVGGFTHLGSTCVNYHPATDTAEMRQIFTYERQLIGSSVRRIGLVVREVRIEKASHGSPSISRRIVTARAAGYRCRLSEADCATAREQMARGITPLAAVREIIRKDRENFELQGPRDPEDMAFGLFQNAANRKKVSELPDDKIILVPGGKETAEAVLASTPVVEVFPDLDEPVIVIVVKN
ncbi:serine/threonine protein kinase [Roseimicrobium gellanilyticum]|uniref:Serine/threonine protein kinase n=1 Tax=Roseimicrobium gellanilyticum TaxID=748857 RepID=A0A366HF90_9BACT|nr:protein kinase [Roseimicrobium gellanilyticum]RBP41234.1 serine/threonine protein kinase [Roseimicrobium gellanilyticum]